MTDAADLALWGVLGLVVLATLSIVVHTLAVGISPMPSSPAARRAVLELLAGRVADGAELHELGAGWGTLAFALARRFPTANVVAWETSPVPWLVCRARLALGGPPNLRVVRRDFFGASLAGAGVVVCYLFTGAMERLGPKLAQELRPGAVVVSNTFALRGWAPQTTVTLDDLYRTPVYRYVQGAAK